MAARVSVHGGASKQVVGGEAGRAEVGDRAQRQQVASEGVMRTKLAASVSPSSLHSLAATDCSSSCSSSSGPLEFHLAPEAEQRPKLKSAPREPQASAQSQRPASKSPILIKYNYYDFNGARQEQPNQDMNQLSSSQGQGRGRLQRQLSPTFKQSLEQIVRGSVASSRLMHSSSGQGSSTGGSSSSPVMSASSSNSSPLPNEQQQPPTAALMLARRYKLSSYEQRCLRCRKTVYQMDKVGPLKDFTFYHQNCFKCRECGTKLTLKTYFNSQHSSTDQEVYCHRHCPKTPAGKLDNQSVGIRAALNAPKVFDCSHLLLHCEPQTLGACCPGQSASASRAGAGAGSVNPQVDSRALYIQHAVQQTRLQAIYKQSQVDQKISQFLSRRLEFLEPRQKLLEMRHRQEEEQLFRVFEQKWRQEESSISEQIKLEWQAELEKLLDKYRRQLSHHLSSQSSRLHSESLGAKASGRPQLAAGAGPGQAEPNEQQMIEFERMNLEKTMTIKLDRKKETLKRKLREFERQATAELVEKQSGEMLALISMKLEEFKEDQKRKIGSDLEHFEAMESLANQLGASSIQPTKQVAAGRPAGRPDQQRLGPPAPAPAQVSKMELYNSEQPDEVFKEIDQVAIGVAQEDQQTFTDLVHHLTRHCLTDVEKVRAIFRWITVKNLNTMEFDAKLKPDTPLGLLRGIKQGSESYHVLFKRLCSYAGLHCVVIKGYSKSAGYQPGARFEGGHFRNSWNAVFVAGAWRFVQCNWGARHLVSVAVMQDKNNSPPSADRQQQVAASSSASSQNYGRRGLPSNGHSNGLGCPNSGGAPRRRDQQLDKNGNHHAHDLAGALSPAAPISSSTTATTSAPNLSARQQQPAANGSTPTSGQQESRQRQTGQRHESSSGQQQPNDSLRYEYDDHYFLTDPDEFIYEFFPMAPEWQLIRSRPITLTEFEQLPFVRSLFFKYGLYFPQPDIRSVLHTDSSGATTIKIGMPTHMIPSLIFHYNLKYFDSDAEHHDGVSLKRFVMQSVESGTSDGPDGQVMISNVVNFRVHLPENGTYILDIFANSTTPTQYITGEPMKFKSVCKFKIIAKSLKTVMIPLPDCASGEYGPMKATRLFGIIPISHETGLITVANEKRFLKIQFRMTRPLLDFMASLHKNGHDERQLSKSIKIFIDGDIVFITIKFPEDGQYGLDVYTRDQRIATSSGPVGGPDCVKSANENKKQLLTHCCKYLINVRTPK